MRKAPVERTGQSRTINARFEQTWVGAKRRYSLLGCGLGVQPPGFIRLLVGLEATLEAHIILSSDGLAIEDEERGDIMFLPEIEVIDDVLFDAGQAAEGR